MLSLCQPAFGLLHFTLDTCLLMVLFFISFVCSLMQSPPIKNVRDYKFLYNKIK